MNSLQVLHHHQVHTQLYNVHTGFSVELQKQPKCKNHCRAHKYTPFPLTSVSFQKYTTYPVFFVSSHFCPKKRKQTGPVNFWQIACTHSEQVHYKCVSVQCSYYAVCLCMIWSTQKSDVSTAWPLPPTVKNKTQTTTKFVSLFRKYVCICVSRNILIFIFYQICHSH